MEKENLERKKEEAKMKRIEKAMMKMPGWKTRGKKFVYEGKQKRWESYVERNAQNGVNLELSVKIMEDLENRPMDEVIKEFQNNIANLNVYRAIRNTILMYSKKGPEFFEKTALEEMDKITKKRIDNIKQDNAIYEKMEKNKTNNEKGEKYTKEEENTPEKEENKTEKFIEDGKTFMYPEREEYWKDFVESAMKTGQQDKLERNIEIMKSLETQSVGEIIKMLNSQNLTRYEFNVIRNMALTYSKKGPDFYMATAGPGEIDYKMLSRINGIRKENERLEQLHSKDEKENEEKRPISSQRQQDEKEIRQKSAEKEKLEMQLEIIEEAMKKATFEMDKLKEYQAQLKQKLDETKEK